MIYSRTATGLLAASLLSACAHHTGAPQHIAALEARHVEHFVALDAQRNLAGGVNAYRAFHNKNGSINTATLSATHPDIIFASQSYHLWQPTLESIAPVKWATQDAHILTQLQQEFLDVGALTHKQRQAKKQWRKLMRHIKATRKQLQAYEAPLLLFYEEGEFYAHGSSASNQLVAQVFDVNLVDRHLAPEKKSVNASYLKHLEPDLVVIFSQDASQQELPEDTFGADALATEPTVLALDAQLWASTELTLERVYELSEALR